MSLLYFTAIELLNEVIHRCNHLHAPMDNLIYLSHAARNGAHGVLVHGERTRCPAHGWEIASRPLDSRKRYQYAHVPSSPQHGFATRTEKKALAKKPLPLIESQGFTEGESMRIAIFVVLASAPCGLRPPRLQAFFAQYSQRALPVHQSGSQRGFPSGSAESPKSAGALGRHARHDARGGRTVDRDHSAAGGRFPLLRDRRRRLHGGGSGNANVLRFRLGQQRH